MAQIDSINGNPLAFNGSQITDGTVTDSKLAPNNGWSRDLAAILSENRFCIPTNEWRRGVVQTDSTATNYGQVVNSTYRVVTTELHYAAHDMYVESDDGYLMQCNLYTGPTEDTYLYGTGIYTYWHMMWHKTMYIPAGMYYRVAVQRATPNTSATESVEEFSGKVKFYPRNAYGADAAMDLAEEGHNVIRRFTWTHNASSGQHVANRLQMAEIGYTDKLLEIVTDSECAVSVNYYRQNGEYVANRGAKCINPGSYFRIVLANSASLNSEVSYSLLEHVKLIERDSNFFVAATNANPLLNSTNARAIQAGLEFADRPVEYYVDDFSTYGLMYYRYASDDVYSTAAWMALQYKPLLIQQGTYYRVAIGKADGTDFASEAEAVAAAAKIKKRYVDYMEPPARYADALRNEISYLKKRVTALEGEVLPGYYEDGSYSLSGRCEDIMALNPYLRPEKAQFIFITDMHAMNGNSLKSRLLMDYVVENTHVDMVVNGGDLIDDKPASGVRPTPLEYGKKLREFHNFTVPDNCNLYLFVAGNHDAGAGWNPTTDAIVDQDTLFRYSNAGRSAGSAVYDEVGNFQYYVDDEYHKIRWIVGSVGNELNIGKWDSSGSHGVVGESVADCITFIGNALKTMHGGWRAVVFNHILINQWPNKGAVTLEQVCDAYNAKTTATISSRYFDFTEASGEVAFIIGGHSHADYEYTTDGGLHCILTTTDNRAQQYVVDGSTHRLDPSIRVDGTPDEQAFDVFTVDMTARKLYATRIGYGDDREWSF